MVATEVDSKKQNQRKVIDWQVVQTAANSSMADIFALTCKLTERKI